MSYIFKMVYLVRDNESNDVIYMSGIESESQRKIDTNPESLHMDEWPVEFIELNKE